MNENEPVFSTRYKLACVYSEDSNQSGTCIHNLISVLSLCLTLRPMASNRVPIQDSYQTADELAGLSLRWAHLATDTSCWTLAQISRVQSLYIMPYYPPTKSEGYSFGVVRPYVHSFRPSVRNHISVPIGQI